MKSRFLLYALIGLLALAVLICWLSDSSNDRESLQVFPATLSRDCAPWDGSGFTVSIPYDTGSVIAISVWQSPDIRVPIKFSFPDETLRIGSALLLPQKGLPEELTGNLRFQRVEQSIPVEGEFHFTAGTGKRFNGKFIAMWGNEVVYCG